MAIMGEDVLVTGDQPWAGHVAEELHVNHFSVECVQDLSSIARGASYAVAILAAETVPPRLELQTLTSLLHSAKLVAPIVWERHILRIGPVLGKHLCAQCAIPRAVQDETELINPRHVRGVFLPAHARVAVVYLQLLLASEPSVGRPMAHPVVCFDSLTLEMDSYNCVGGEACTQCGPSASSLRTELSLLHGLSTRMRVPPC
jgi:hypothetical protein